MNDSKQQFEKRITYLLSFERGMSNTLSDGDRIGWRDGFLLACGFWYYRDGDFRERFRAVVDEKKNVDEDLNRVVRGYDDAIRVFREAKRL